MKKAYKLLVVVFGVFLLCGCFGEMTPSERVEDMFNRYIKNDHDIMEEVDDYLNKQDLTKNQRNRYREVIKDEYATIKYSIEDEKIDGDEATVEAKIEVKDLYKVSKDTGNYLKDNPEEFYVNGSYDEAKFIDYKLDKMENNKDTIEYNIQVTLRKSDNIWTVDALDNSTLEKIHGIYDYENDSTGENKK